MQIISSYQPDHGTQKMKEYLDQRLETLNVVFSKIMARFDEP